MRPIENEALTNQLPKILTHIIYGRTKGRIEELEGDQFG